MPYKIPTAIRYEEKLFGPLTIKQSIYAGIAVSIALYMIFFSSFDFVIRIIVSIVVILLAVGFIMFDLETYLGNYISFMRQDREASWISPAARKLMDIKSIKADTEFLKNGNAIAAIRVIPINFGVLGKEDRDSVIYGFLQFLNSLNFSIQIVMRSVNLDLSDYLTNLKRRIIQRDDKMALAYYEHFSEYMYDYIKKNRVNDRLFYIVVPAKKHWDEREMIRNLDSRCKSIIETLSRSGIVAERLGNKELLNLYSSYFTQSFYMDEEYLSPITMYKKIWKGSSESGTISSPSVQEIKAEPTAAFSSPKESQIKERIQKSTPKKEPNSLVN
ncbi:MAG: PrgI family protein [Candidatus Altiarchaeota archaeon]|nr:PrgI family protein [Candidatus Altiarchaeota archaeon]MBU4341435.1 PrgI family protein [Candidatus Altiarchaeota archaeon]